MGSIRAAVTLSVSMIHPVNPKNTWDPHDLTRFRWRWDLSSISVTMMIIAVMIIVTAGLTLVRGRHLPLPRAGRYQALDSCGPRGLPAAMCSSHFAVPELEGRGQAPCQGHAGSGEPGLGSQWTRPPLGSRPGTLFSLLWVVTAPGGLSPAGP